jgi:acyl carrier protein
MSASRIERVISVIAEQLNVPQAEITGETVLSTLYIDSLDTVEIVMALEDEFGVVISDPEWEPVKTVAQAVDLVNSKLGVAA